MGLTLKTYKMKKIILTIAFIASGLVASAQVGIGNTDPKVSLQVDKSADAAKADGVLVPRVTVAELNTKAAAYGADQNGSLVFITAITGAANETSNVTAAGFHYYNSATDKWVAVGGGGAAPAYQDIRGKVQPVTAATYTVAADDFYILTTGSGTAITIPTSGTGFTVADAGRTIYIFNDNAVAIANTWAGTTPSGNITGLTNQFRGGIFLWTGTKWIYTGK